MAWSCRSTSQLPASKPATGYRFRDRGLLEHALTHKSRAAEDPSGGVADNESMEFLGDAVLGFVVADVLYREFPQYTEGPKSKAKAAMVSTTALAGMSRALGLGEAMLLGRGEEKTGGRTKQALLADVFEAVIAAIYLDGGIEAARGFIERQIGRCSPTCAARRPSAAITSRRCRSTLQAQGRSLPTYRVPSESGPDHEKRFTSTCGSTGKCWRPAPGGRRRKPNRRRPAGARFARRSAGRLRIGRGSGLEARV